MDSNSGVQVLVAGDMNAYQIPRKPDRIYLLFIVFWVLWDVGFNRVLVFRDGECPSASLSGRCPVEGNKLC